MYRQGEAFPVLVVSFAGKVFGLDPSSGEILWETKFALSGTAELLIEEERIYAVESQHFMILEYPTGRLLAQTQLPVTYRGRATLVVEGDRILIGMGGEVVAVDRAGKQLWFQQFKGKGVGSIALGFPGNVRQADVSG